MDTRTRFYRNSQGTRITPPHGVSSQECAIRNVNAFTPFHNNLGYIFQREGDIRCPIPGLFRRGSPLKIALFIMSIIINAVQRVIRGRFSPHFFVELREGIKSKLNATAPVSVIATICRVGTSLAGIAKSPILGSVGGSVNMVSLRRDFGSTASAGRTRPFHQRPSSDGTDGTTHTKTYPPRPLYPFQHCPTAKSTARQVSGFESLYEFRPIASTRSGLATYQVGCDNSDSVTAFTPTVPHRMSFIDASKSENQQFSELLSCQLCDTPRSFCVGIYGKVVSSHCSKDIPFMNMVRNLGGVNYLSSSAFRIA